MLILYQKFNRITESAVHFNLAGTAHLYLSFLVLSSSINDLFERPSTGVRR